MIREKLPDAAIGIFIHATFPSSEIFRCLQSKKQVKFISQNQQKKLSFLFNPLARNKILQGMLGANLIGFQVNNNNNTPSN